MYLDTFKDVADLQQQKKELEYNLNKTTSEYNSCKLLFSGQLYEAKRSMEKLLSFQNTAQEISSSEVKSENYCSLSEELGISKLLLVTIDSIEEMVVMPDSLLSVPDIYIIANVISDAGTGCKPVCVSSNQSRTASYSNYVEWNQELKMYANNTDSLILNVYCSQVIAADLCIGQVVIDITSHAEEMAVDGGKHIVLRLPLKKCKYVIYNNIGEEIPLNDYQKDADATAKNNVDTDIEDYLGYVNISIEMPNATETTCGWITNTTGCHISGESADTCVWAVLCLNSLQIYRSPYAGRGTLVREFDLSHLAEMIEIIYDKYKTRRGDLQINFFPNLATSQSANTDTLILSFGDRVESKIYWQNAILSQVKLAYQNITV